MPEVEISIVRCKICCIIIAFIIIVVNGNVYLFCSGSVYEIKSVWIGFLRNKNNIWQWFRLWSAEKEMRTYHDLIHTAQIEL